MQCKQGVNEKETTAGLAPFKDINFKSWEMELGGFHAISLSFVLIKFGYIEVVYLFLNPSPSFSQSHRRLWIIQKDFTGGMKAADIEGEMIHS